MLHPKRLRLVLCGFAICLFSSEPRCANALDEAETLEILIQAIGRSESDQVRVSLMKGILDGLSGRRDVAKPSNWDEVSKRLGNAGSPEVQKLVDRLSQSFGDQKAMSRALDVLLDKSAGVDRRRDALKSLVTQKYGEVGPHLTSLLGDEGLRLDVIRAFSIFIRDEAPSTLIGRFEAFGDAERRAVIQTLSTRKSYAKALVKAISKKTIRRDQIPAYLARSLRDLLGKEFTDAYGEIPELTNNSKQLIAKYKKIITPEALAKADPSRGRAVFQKTCGACHLMYGAGGKVGPDLTGSNRANLDYFLLNSIAPSEDVAEGYRMVTILTDDGRNLNGIVAAEDNQRVVLKTVDQPKVVVAKPDIIARRVSPKSMMPEGQLEQLSTTQLLDLVRYLRTTSQVELPAK